MKSLFYASLCLIAITGVPADIETGRAKVQMVCAACHGANGVSVSDVIPNLITAAVKAT